MAKEAARGESSQGMSLPPELHSPLLVSIAAQRQALVVALQECWGEIWRQSPRHSKMSRIDSSMPSNKYRWVTDELSRAESSIVIQLRTGHAPLNAYLYRITKLDSLTCMHCRAGDETVHHYLFDCMSWRNEHWLLGHSLGRASKSLQNLLSTKRGISKVLKFIGRMQRFQGSVQ